MKSFIRTVIAAAKTFWVDDYAYQASALSFITLLSIVPFLAILTFTISISGEYIWILNATRAFIYENFLPASEKILQKYLQDFSESASKLPFMSLIFFIITVLLFINTLEKTINIIWDVKAYRSVRKRLISWSAMLLFPIFIAITSLINNIFDFFFDNTYLIQSFLTITLFISQVFIFTLLYLLVTNVKLKWTYFLIGGILVTTLFQILKFFFIMYIKYFTNFEAIYSSLAVIPVFLTWLYFSWIVFLYGSIFIKKQSESRSS